jgi:predicted HAD superfamily hydrolase
MQVRQEALFTRETLAEGMPSGTTGPASSGCIEQLLRDLRPLGERSRPFLEIAPSLYLFTARLYQVALDNGIQDLMFFSREGQLLKQMFDFHQAVQCAPNSIRTHYLKVSRRSTFLLSLGVLAQEKFDILFRQYRQISILDFLKSLDLEDHAASLCDAMNLDVATLELVRDDLPRDSHFRALLQLDLFQDIYETQRLDRSRAFALYIASVLGVKDLPERLSVVDIGWKGTIQDNLYKSIIKQCPRAQIDGYYLGLAAPGNLSANNRKHGLLYTYRERGNQTYRVFSEHRSLFEIVLYADHGSARRYVVDETGIATVIEDESKRADLANEKVRPVSQAIISYVRQLSTELRLDPLLERELAVATLRRHTRMAFHPTRSEIDWIRAISHSENFGIFDDSWFHDPNAPAATFVNRIRFTWLLLFRRQSFQPFLWPWLTIKSRALPGTSTLYGWFRCFRH